jgi:hypothetical protein
LKPYFFDLEVYNSADQNIPKNWISGQNEKGILIVCSLKDKTDENLTLLTKILAAIHFQLDTDCLSLWIPKGDSIGIQGIIKEKKINRVVCFGLEPSTLGLSMVKVVYVPLNLQKIDFLFSHSLEQIKKNRELKKVLWGALKNMFTT